MGSQINFTVGKDYDGKLVKEFLRRGCGVSASLLTQLKLVKNGIVKNGNHVRSVDRVYFGDMITITMPQDKNDIIPVNLPLNILYEDDYLIVFDKRPFMAVHPVHGHIDDTLANGAAYYAQSKGEHWTFRAVNRLDRDTSGALLVAKDAYSAALLPKTVTKKYIAVCEGIINKRGTVDAPIRLKEGHTIQREVGEGGINAVTHYKPLKQVNGHTLVEFDLETGRTHQIRVHMSSLGFPLAGDDMYGGKRDLICRQALHCGELSFIHPVTKNFISVCCPLPDDIMSLL